MSHDVTFLKLINYSASGLALGFYLPQGPRVAQATASYSLMLGSQLVLITRLPFLLLELKWVRMFIHQ